MIVSAVSKDVGAALPAKRATPAEQRQLTRDLAGPKVKKNKAGGIMEQMPPSHREWVFRHASQLGHVPAELAPQSWKHGEHSYTVRSPKGACVEVLLRHAAYYVKQCAPGGCMGDGISKHVPWKRDGDSLTTWAALKVAINW